jgi:ubiquinone/menaquinone biosynthesis C-methylase UbiE
VIQPLRRALADVYDELAPDHTVRGTTVLPAKHLRFGGKEFKNDDFFLASAQSEAQRLVRRCGLSTESAVLDVGCGVGRLPIGILDQVGDVRAYRGVDVHSKSIRWCKLHIEGAHPSFQFQVIDVKNHCYNPSGSPLSGSFRLPFDDGSFNIIYLYSVFSHMMPDDVSVYFAEFTRLLRPEGKTFLTAFLEEGVPDAMENPPDYRMKWNGPLHCVRYNMPFFTKLAGSAGLRVSEFEYGQETDGQSAVYLARTSVGGRTKP